MKMRDILLSLITIRAVGSVQKYKISATNYQIMRINSHRTLTLLLVGFLEDVNWWGGDSPPPPLIIIIIIYIWHL